MADLEIGETIKGKAENPVGIADVFSDRVSVKSTNPKYKDFPPMIASKYFVPDYERVKNFKVYEDDIWLVGFFRSGTTLTQELLWLVLHDYNYDLAMSSDTYNRAQWFDMFNVVHAIQGVDYDYMDKMPRPRIFKTHFPVQFLPDQIWTVKPKLVYIEREVKDLSISCYYFRKNIVHETIGPITDHFEDFLNDTVWYGPYREHVLNYRNLPDYDNIFIWTYEQLVNDTEVSIREIVKFLNKTITDEQLLKLKDHLKVDKMKKNKMTNMSHYLEKFNATTNENLPTDIFIRKGIVGDHKNEMTPEMIKRFDDWWALRTTLKPGYNK